MKKALLFLLPILIGGLYFLLEHSKEKVATPFNIQKELKKKANKEYLEKNIQQELNSHKLYEAKTLINLATFLKVDINKSLIQKFQEENSSFKQIIYQSKEFLNGFITGKINSTASLVGSFSSDFSLIGDIRDIYYEGNRYLNHQEYNKLILSLSLAGVALSIGAIPSFGATLPLKAATATLKGASKNRYLTKDFQSVLEKKLSKSIHLQQLKQIDLSSIEALKKDQKKLSKLVEFKHIKPILNSLATITKNTSTLDTIKIMRFIHSEKELHKAALITKKYKKNSYGLFKVLKRDIFRGVKFVFKKGILYFTILFLITILFIIWLFTLLSFIKRA